MQHSLARLQAGLQTNLDNLVLAMAAERSFEPDWQTWIRTHVARAIIRAGRWATIRTHDLAQRGANADHGWRRTNEDKRRAVMRLLNDPEWAEWGDREIARQCKVSHMVVQKLRPPHLATLPDRTRTAQRGDGAPYEMDTSCIGRGDAMFEAEDLRGAAGGRITAW
jgi:hypothetical protein